MKRRGIEQGFFKVGAHWSPSQKEFQNPRS